MLKVVVLSFLTLALSFFVGTSYISAQEATNTPAPSPTAMEDEEDDDVPEAAPQTGFGY